MKVSHLVDDILTVRPHEGGERGEGQSNEDSKVLLLGTESCGALNCLCILKEEHSQWMLRLDQILSEALSYYGVKIPKFQKCL